MARTLEELRRDLARDMGLLIEGETSGTASTTALVDTNRLGIFTENDALVGGMVVIADASATAPEGEWGWITAYSASANRVAFVPAMTVATGTDMGYEIYRAPLSLDQWNKAVNEAISDAWPEVWRVQREEFVSTSADQYAVTNSAQEVIDVKIVLGGDYAGLPHTPYPRRQWITTGTPGASLQLELRHPVPTSDRTIQAIYKQRYGALAVGESTDLDWSYIMAAAAANAYQMLHGEAGGQADESRYAQFLNFWRQEAKERKVKLNAALEGKPLPAERKKG